MVVRILFCIPLACSILSWFGTPVRAEYGFSIVAEYGTVIDSHTITDLGEESNLAINDHGEIAFVASVRSQQQTRGSYSVMTSERFVLGVSDSSLAPTDPRVLDEDYGIAINNEGQVAYAGELGDYSDVVFLNDEVFFSSAEFEGRPATASTDTNSVAISNDGVPVFRSYFVDSKSHALTNAAQVVVGGELSGLVLEDVNSPKVNSTGSLAFVGTTLRPIQGTDHSVFVDGRRIIGTGDVISDMTISRIVTLGNVNDQGKVSTVVADAHRNTAVAVDDEIVLGIGDSLLGYDNLRFQDSHLTDDDRLIVLASIFDGENRWVADGLFIDNDLILKSGDEIEGQVVDDMGFSIEGNARGDIALRVEFSSGSEAIVFGAVPEPANGSYMLPLLLVAAYCRRRSDTKRDNARLSER